MLDNIEEYEHYIYSIADNYPEIEYSNLKNQTWIFSLKK